ncbi:MAG: transglycosylase SLT domain-containing protein, partial [archaeon]|nr:transglycosylase SLT domain-containing protein [archaeon]
MPFGRLKNMKKSTKQKIGRIVRWPIIAVGITASLSGPTPKALRERIYSEIPKPVAEKIIEQSSSGKNFSWGKLPAKLVPFEIRGFVLKYEEKPIDLGKQIVKDSRTYNLHPLIAEKIPKLFLRESELNPNAVAKRKINGKIVVTGIGLGQLSPDTIKLARRNGVPIKNPFNPVENARVAVWALSYFDSYLCEKIPKFSELPADERAPFVLLAFKYGPETVIRGDHTHTDGYTEFILHADSAKAFQMFRKGNQHELFNAFNGT